MQLSKEAEELKNHIIKTVADIKGGNVYLSEGVSNFLPVSVKGLALFDLYLNDEEWELVTREDYLEGTDFSVSTDTENLSLFNTHVYGNYKNSKDVDEIFEHIRKVTKH